MPEKIPWPFTRLYDRYPNRIFVKWFGQIVTDINKRGISGKILDVGTGPGRLPIEIAKRLKNVKVFGIDLSEDMIKLAKTNAEKEDVGNKVEFRVGSAYDTGFKTGSMDLVLSTGMIHHLKEPPLFFNEIHRILKYGGEAWLFDGRKDATRAEFYQTVRSLGVEGDLPLPLQMMGTIWPRIHVGYRTEIYRSGKVAVAIKESLFRSADVTEEGAYMRIELRKT